MTVELIPAQIGIPGGMELAVILLIAILLFGANKIPKLARSTGQAMGEFKRGREQVEQELDEMKGDVEEAADVSEAVEGVDEALDVEDDDAESSQSLESASVEDVSADKES